MKQISDFIITANQTPAPGYSLLELSMIGDTHFPEILPGQFVQVKVDNSPSTFLRRPISICSADPNNRTITLLIREAGEGTKHLCSLDRGSVINIVFPLGKSFSVESDVKRPLLIGGGVGIAPMIMLGNFLRSKGIVPTFLTGARSETALLMLDELKNIGEAAITTDDGSAGEKGFVINHSIMQPEKISEFDMIYCCGPAPMMKAVAALARDNNIRCEVSLENMMACGIGACLCCVEKTVKGNICVCTEGPVFNIDELTW